MWTAARLVSICKNPALLVAAQQLSVPYFRVAAGFRWPGTIYGLPFLNEQAKVTEDNMRTILTLISSALIFGTSAWAQDPAADFPNKPIKIVVCVPAGGGVDTVARIVAEGLHQKLGQPVVVENRAGAAGNIGAEYVYASDPDGCEASSV